MYVEVYVFEPLWYKNKFYTTDFNEVIVVVLRRRGMGVLHSFKRGVTLNFRIPICISLTGKCV